MCVHENEWERGKTLDTINEDIVIDVGANKGEFSFEIAKRNPEIKVLSIEPFYKLSQDLINYIESKNVKNVDVIHTAVDLEEGTRRFNIADHHDKGVSSLLTFNESKIQENSYWSTRQDLFFDEFEHVQTQKLETLLKEYHFNAIRFLKIDAQGVDLNVLKSLGPYLERLHAGMIEAPATLQSALYSEEQDDLYQVCEYLKEHQFYVYAIKPNDPAANEFNVFFCREGMDFKKIEEALGLQGIDLYDGKHFWAYPSSHPNQAEEVMQKNKEAIHVLNTEVHDLRTEIHSLRTEIHTIRTALDSERAKNRLLVTKMKSMLKKKKYAVELTN